MGKLSSALAKKKGRTAGRGAGRCSCPAEWVPIYAGSVLLQGYHEPPAMGHRLGYLFFCLGISLPLILLSSVQFSSVAQSCLTLCDPMNRSMPGLPVQHQLPEFTQTHVHWVGDAIQPSHPLLSPSPPALNLFQHQDLFQWVSSSHQVAKVLEFRLQHQSFQWTPRTDLL